MLVTKVVAKQVYKVSNLEITEYLLGNIREVGLDPMDIKYVLILQGHRDHYGGAPALQEIIDAQFGTAEEDQKMMVADFGEYAPRIDFFVEEGDSLTLGDTTLDFELTPGHTPGTTSIRLSVFDDGTEHLAYLHGGPALRSDDPEVGRVFIEDLERIKQIPGIEVQISNHFDIHASGAPDLFGRAELLANRQPGEPHPWVDPDHFQRWLDELIATTRTGAEAGFDFLWLIIIGCIIKVFAQIELGRYAITNGKTTLAALSSKGWIIRCSKHPLNGSCMGLAIPTTSRPWARRPRARSIRNRPSTAPCGTPSGKCATS